MKLLCPDCGQPIPADDTNVDTGIAKCRACGGVLNIFQALGLPAPGAAPVPAGPESSPLPKPPRMHVEDRGMEGWTVRWRWFTPKYVFLLFFCVLWDGFLVFWYSVALFSSDPMKIMALVFPLLHVSVGVGLTYAVIADFLNHTVVTLTNTTLTIRHAPMMWLGNRTIPIENIEQLYCKQSSVQKNNQHSYELWVKLRQSDPLRLVTLDDLDEARFLEQQIEGQLGIKPQRVAGEYRGDAV